MRIIDLALKDLMQIVRDKRMTMFLVIMPIVFTAFMGFAFNQGGSSSDDRLLLGYIDADNTSPLSMPLRDLLSNSSVVRLESIAPAEADAAIQRVRDEKLAALITVPTGFGVSGNSGTPAARLNVVVDRNSSAGQAAYNAIQTAVVRVFTMAEIADLGVKTIGAQADRAALVQSAAQAWQTPPITIDVQSAASTKSGGTSNPYAQTSPGMIVQFAVFGLITSASVLVLERKQGTLQRMLTTSMRRGEIIAAHVLAMFMLVFIQTALLIVVGQFAFNVNYLREPLGTLIVVVALSLWVAALGLFISTVAKGEEQVLLYSLIAMFLFTALAGAWFPLEGTGPAFSMVGHLTPGAWAMDGFQNIVVRGLGLNSALLPAAVLAGFAVVFFGLAVWRFKFE